MSLGSQSLGFVVRSLARGGFIVAIIGASLEVSRVAWAVIISSSIITISKLISSFHISFLIIWFLRASPTRYDRLYLRIILLGLIWTIWVCPRNRNHHLLIGERWPGHPHHSLLREPTLPKSKPGAICTSILLLIIFQILFRLLQIL